MERSGRWRAAATPRVLSRKSHSIPPNRWRSSHQSPANTDERMVHTTASTISKMPPSNSPNRSSIPSLPLCPIVTLSACHMGCAGCANRLPSSSIRIYASGNPFVASAAREPGRHSRDVPARHTTSSLCPRASWGLRKRVVASVMKPPESIVASHGGDCLSDCLHQRLVASCRRSSQARFDLGKSFLNR